MCSEGGHRRLVWQENTSEMGEMEGDDPLCWLLKRATKEDKEIEEKPWWARPCMSKPFIILTVSSLQVNFFICINPIHTYYCFYDITVHTCGQLDWRKPGSPFLFPTKSFLIPKLWFISCLSTWGRKAVNSTAADLFKQIRDVCTGPYPRFQGIQDFINWNFKHLLTIDFFVTLL